MNKRNIGKFFEKIIEKEEYYSSLYYTRYYSVSSSKLEK